MKRVKNFRYKAVKLFAALLTTLTSLSYAPTLAKDYDKASSGFAVSSQGKAKTKSDVVNANELDKNSEKKSATGSKAKEDEKNVHENKIKDWKRESKETLKKIGNIELFGEEFKGGLSENLCDKLNEYKIVDRQSLIKGLEYAKKFKECREILDSFENIEVFGYKSNNMPQTFICAKEKKCGFNVSLWPERDSNKIVFNQIFVPMSLPYDNLKSNAILHLLEHMSVPIFESSVFSLSPYYFGSEDLTHNAATFEDSSVTYFSEASCYNTLSWFKSIVSYFNSIKKLNRKKLKLPFDTERERIRSEMLGNSAIYRLQAKFVDDPRYLLVNKLTNLGNIGLDYKKLYDIPAVKILEQLSVEEVFDALKKATHPSNMCASFCVENKLGNIFNFLFTIKKYCEGYEPEESSYLKTERQQLEYINKYVYKKEYKNSERRYVKDHFNAGEHVNLFRNHDYNKNAPENERESKFFNCTDRFCVKLNKIGFKDVTTAVKYLLLLKPYAIQEVVGKDEIKKLTGFEKFLINYNNHQDFEGLYKHVHPYITPLLFTEELSFHICGNDESSFSEDNLANNVHKVLNAFVKKCLEMSDDDFFKLNIISDLPRDMFANFDAMSLGEAVIRSYDGDKFNVSKNLDINKDGIVQESRDRCREIIINNKHLIKNLSRPLSSYTTFLAIKMPGTNPPEKVDNKQIVNSFKNSRTKYKIPIKFNCSNNELGFITKFIVSQFYINTLYNRGWSYASEIGDLGVAAQLKPVKNCLESSDNEINVNFFKEYFNNGKVEELYNKFLEEGLSLLFEKSPIDDYINIVKAKFINYLKKCSAYLYDMYEENRKSLEKLNNIKDLDNLSDKFFWDITYNLPGIKYVKRVPIANSSEKYKKFIESYEKFLKAFDEKRKEMGNKYKDICDKNNNESLERNYFKEKAMYLKEVLFKSLEYFEKARDILMDEIKVYENSEDLSVENIKESLHKNVEFVKFEEVNADGKKKTKKEKKKTKKENKKRKQRKANKKRKNQI